MGDCGVGVRGRSRVRGENRSSGRGRGGGNYWNGRQLCGKGHLTAAGIFRMQLAHRNLKVGRIQEEGLRWCT